ncbi:MAG: extracellular solute-binding protein [Oscillospiraceae bacterium]|nr:extracellular solute-binding protein [Oscillospiraceae bacterium]
MRDFMIMVLECSAGMSALALLYMILAPLLSRRYSEKWRYYTWLVIVIGLIIPFRPHFGSAVIRVDMSGEPGVRSVERAEYGRSEMENATAADRYDDFIDIEKTGENHSFWEPNTAPFAGNAANAAETPKISAIFPKLSLWEIVTAVWLLGLIVSLAYHAVNYLRFAKTANRWSQKVEDEQTLSLFCGLKTEMGISEAKKIALESCPLVGIPLLIGITRPRILLPEIDLNRSELQFILKHELTHYKRKDIWHRLLLIIAAAIHWFNPFVYLMIKAVDISCERSCDAEVIRGTNMETRWKYGNTILDVAKYRRKAKTLLATHLNDGKKGMKSRLSAIMDAGRKRGGVIIACVIVVAVLATGLLLAVNTSKPLDNTPKQDKGLQADAEGNSTPLNYLEQLPETDTLVLWRNYANKWLLDPAVNIFKEMYPNVKVEVRDFENDPNSYWTLLETELPAGKGPDLILSSANDFFDIYKVMDTDVFCDLNDFIESDHDFNLDEYKKVVLDSGIYKNKRYIMPLSYDTNVLITTDETLEAEGINNIDNLHSFDGLVEEIKTYLNRYTSTKFVYDWQFQGINMFFPWCGLQYIDYENKTLNVDGDDFRKVMEAYKDIYRQDMELAELPSVTYIRDTTDALLTGKSIFGRIRSWHIFTYTFGALENNGYSPVYFNFSSINREKGARVTSMAVISNASQNKLNAYAFLKILLSEQIQGNPKDVTITEFPVLESAVGIHAIYRFEDSKYSQYEDRLIPLSSEEIMRDFSNLTDEIEYSTLILYTNQVESIIFNDMLPYFKSEDTYANCLNKLRNELELYLSE